MLSLIVGLFLGALSVIFALQNVFSVTVTFLSWDITASLALIIVVVILIGFVVALLLTLPESIKRSFVISGLQKENNTLKDEVENQKQKREEVVVASAIESDQTVL